MPPTLYLIDGHALAYRTFFAMATSRGDSLRTSSGEPTGAIFGFMNILLGLLQKEMPQYLAVAFDTGKTFRNDIFPEYKATRAKMPDELRSQIEVIREIIDAFNIPRLEKEGAEADDILGSIAKQAVIHGLAVKIITGDRDLLQLVTDRVWVNLPGKSMADARDYDQAAVIEKMGVKPEQIVDLKALMGDSSDNIPGVPGVGEKTAQKLIEEYNTLDSIYEHIEDIPPRFRAKLEAGKESAYLSQRLARIDCDIDIRLDLDHASTKILHTKAVEEIFQSLEFRTLLGRLRDLGNQTQKMSNGPQLSLFGEKIDSVGTPAKTGFSTVIIDTPKTLAELKTRLESAGWISFDTETTHTDPMLADLVGISVAVDSEKGYYIPVGHQTGKQLPFQEVIDALKPALENQTIQKAGHNLKYDGLVLSAYGIRVQPYTFDSMLAGWLIDPASYNLGLKDMAARYLDLEMQRIESLIGSGKNQLNMAEVAIDSVAPYAAADAIVPLLLKPILMDEMRKFNAEAVFETIEMPLIAVLEKMEKNGILLDVPFFEKMNKELAQSLQGIETKIFKLVGHSLNLNSPQQLSVALFETLGLDSPSKKKTASGHYSTNFAVLEQMQGQHEVVDLILEYRELSKLQSTYVSALPLQVNPRTGRVHTSFSQTGSVTGRLASVNPNLQNIPTRTDIGRKVRDGFIASPGQLLLSVDYSQIELRIVAHMSGDKAMLKAFRDGQDIHATTAAAVYGIPIREVTNQQRRHAKAINFGLIYGMSPFGLSRSTGLTLAEAENFTKAYFNQFPGVKEYLDGLKYLAMQQGFVETLLGRRRYFPNLSSAANMNVRNREEREAINAPIQGTAADILKLAMIKLPDALQKAKVGAKLLLQVHDELLLECSQDELEKTARVVREVMENAYQLSIPLSTEAKSGKNWGNMKPMQIEQQDGTL